MGIFMEISSGSCGHLCGQDSLCGHRISSKVEYAGNCFHVLRGWYFSFHPANGRHKIIGTSMVKISSMGERLEVW